MKNDISLKEEDGTQKPSPTSAGGKGWQSVEPDPAPPEVALAKAIMAEGEDVPTAILRYIRALVPIDGALVLSPFAHRKPNFVINQMDLPDPTEACAQYLDGAYKLDPFHTVLQARPGTALYGLRDVMPDRFRQTEYYRIFYTRLALNDEICIFVQVGERDHVSFSIGRSHGSPPFTVKEKRRLEDALPVIEALTLRWWNGRGAVAAIPIEQVRSEAKPDTSSGFADDVLTARESEIAELILQGHSSTSIALNAGITVGTVKIHRKNIYRKLNISSQAELFALFLKKNSQFG